jgi:ferredoxin, 2Fe-2S
LSLYDKDSDTYCDSQQQISPIQFAANSIQRRRDMPTVKFIEHNGTEHVVEGNSGDSLMSIAMNNLVPGIDADCGGECSCATCHVLVDEAWVAKTGEISEGESSMLDLNPDRSENSRLSCQIPLTDDLDGITIQLPEFQY